LDDANFAGIVATTNDMLYKASDDLVTSARSVDVIAL